MINRITLLLIIGLAWGQSDVDPLEAPRLAKSAAEKAQAKGRQLSPIELREIRNRAAAEAELDALAKAAAEKAKRKLAQELGLDYEKAIVLNTAVIYLLNGERIDGDIVEIVAADKYIVVRTESLERRRISYAYIDYIRHNNKGLADYLQAAGKEPEPKPEPVIWSNSPELDVIKKTPTIPKVKKQQFESTARDKRIANLKQNPIKSGRIESINNKQVENKYISKQTKRTLALIITGSILITIYADMNNTSYYGWN